MPAPMPPQGGPAQAPPDQPSPQGAPSGGQSGAIQELVQNVQAGLAHLKDFFEHAEGVGPQEKQMIGQISQMFDQLVGGGGEEAGPDSQAQGQTAPMEAGGNKGAVPSPV